jgi:hypothetical protein
MRPSIKMQKTLVNQTVPSLVVYSEHALVLQGDIQMLKQHRILFAMVRPSILSLILLAGFNVARSQPVAASAPPAPIASEKDLADTQAQLIKLLRLSPTLTTVVARDPSLLSNQEYVSRSNPQLAQFIQLHPEIARNPEFYLFSHLEENQGPDEALERAVWPELLEQHREPSIFATMMGDGVPFMIFVCVLAALLWLIRLFMDNRRWTRIFKLQMDVHGRLIDKFASNQELLVYMDTEAGKRFLEAAPIPIDFEHEQRVPSAVARVLTPLQIGVVLTLLGAGLLFLRHAYAELNEPMLVFGTVILMPGLGFIISAGITWLLAGRLGLIPENPGAGNRVSPLFDRTDQKDRP